MKKTELLWGLSGVLTSSLTLVICLQQVIGYYIPVALLRILGVALLLSLSFMAFMTVKYIRANGKRNSRDNETDNKDSEE